MGLIWNALATDEETGGSAVLNYKIRWNQGSLINVMEDKEIVVATGDPTYSLQIGSLTGGSYYQFTILAQNIHGWGSESAIFTENAAGRPSKPETVITMISGTYIKVDWEPSLSNYKTITYYVITILDKGSGTFAEDKTLCDGTNAETISNTVCNIPIKSLRLDPYSDYDYILGDIPQFKVSAYNVRGISQASDANTVGAAIQTEPSRMGTVVRNSATTENEIIIDWSALESPYNGDAEVIAYNLQWYREETEAWADLYGVLPQQVDT